MLDTPASAKRLAKSVAFTSVTLAQPSVATMPFMASMPTMMCPANFLQASSTKVGSCTALVPIITNDTPASK